MSATAPTIGFIVLGISVLGILTWLIFVQVQLDEDDAATETLIPEELTVDDLKVLQRVQILGLLANQPIRTDENRHLVTGNTIINEVVDLESRLTKKNELDFQTGVTRANPVVNCVRLFAKTDNRLYSLQSSGAESVLGPGNVVGPFSSTNEAVVRFDGVTGQLIQNSLVTVDDSGNLSTPGTITGSNLTSSSFQLATGLIVGGAISINADDTKFDISAGNGVIVNSTTGVSSPVSWTGLIAQSTVFIGLVTYVSMDSTGTPVFGPNRPSNAFIRDNIFLGALGHVNGVNLSGVGNEPMTILNTNNQLRDLFVAIGPLNIEGNTPFAPAATKQIAKSSGEILLFGANFQNNVNDPHLLGLPAISTALGGTFQYVYQDGSSGPLTVTLIISDEYDDGNGQSNPGTVLLNQWTSQRLYILSNNNWKIQPGQFFYTSLAAAKEGIGLESFVTESDLADNALLFGFCIVRGGATNLQDIGDAEFLSAGKFGSSSSPFTGSVTTLQGAYNNSGIEPEILTDSLQGPVCFKRGSALDTDSVFGIRRGDDFLVWSFIGNGTLNGESAAIEDGDYTLQIIHRATAFQDTRALQIGYETGAIPSTAEETALLVVMEKSASLGGQIHGLTIVSTDGLANSNAIQVGATVDVIQQLSGPFGTPSLGTIDNNGVAVPVGSLAGVDLFLNNTDFVIVANVTQFEEIEFILGVVANAQGILPTFEFSSGAGPTFTAFSAIDGTNGMRSTGVITWNSTDVPPGSWVSDGGVFQIRITRTRMGLGVVPQAVNNGINIAIVTEYSWDKNGDINVNSVTVDTSVSVNNGAFATTITSGATTSHTITLPVDNGANGTTLQNNGSGVLSWKITPEIKIVSNVLQNISTATYTKVVWVGIDGTNVNLTFASDDIVVNTTGTYHVGFEIGFSDDTTPGTLTQRTAFITQNVTSGFNATTDFRFGESSVNHDDVGCVLTGSSMIQCTTTNTLQIWVFQNSGETLTVPTAVTNNARIEFWAFKIN